MKAKRAVAKPPEQLALKERKRREKPRNPKKFRWFRLFFFVEGKSKQYWCSHKAGHFAIGETKRGLTNVTCTFGYRHQAPEGFSLKRIETEG